MILRKTPLKRGKKRLKRTKLKPVNKQRMAKKRAKYRAYLASPAWKEKRKLVLERDGFRCTAKLEDGSRCLAKTKLEIHHLRYTHIFDEPLDDLVTLCSFHHRKVEQELRPWKTTTGRSPK